MGAVAKEAGTVVSAVMLGAVAGSGVFPFTREDYESVVRAGGGASAEASLRGFSLAYEKVASKTHSALETDARAGDGLRVEPAMTKPPGTDPGSMEEFPTQVQDMLSLGHARMLEYQGEGYAKLYTNRLKRVLAADRQADPARAQAFATTREIARWLALWMAFDDIVRVADLKSRAPRWDRVRREVKAGNDDLLKVYDHFKPGAPEFAALLPLPLAQRVLTWDRARVLKGKSPWALPLKVGTHSVMGMLALRTLAGLKWLRVRGSRYATEQAMIDRWLHGVVQGMQRDWQLGHEIALCGRLIKGYGATNERGKENLLHVLDHLAAMPDPRAAALAIAAAREAALADDAGKALDATLVQHGAPPRPVKEQPIRFVRNTRPPGNPDAGPGANRL
jgi:indolepyruvate ferredoxin oxidoreductase beta subunit